MTQTGKDPVRGIQHAGHREVSVLVPDAEESARDIRVPELRRDVLPVGDLRPLHMHRRRHRGYADTGDRDEAFKMSG